MLDTIRTWGVGLCARYLRPQPSATILLSDASLRQDYPQLAMRTSCLGLLCWVGHCRRIAHHNFRVARSIYRLASPPTTAPLCLSSQPGVTHKLYGLCGCRALSFLYLVSGSSVNVRLICEAICLLCNKLMHLISTLDQCLPVGGRLPWVLRVLGGFLGKSK